MEIDKKKVLIVTFHFVDNYGGVLQAYALHKAIADLGHSVQIVDYIPDHVEKGGRFKLPCSIRDIKANIKIAYLKYAYLKAQFLGNKDKRRKYADFRATYLSLTAQKFRYLSELNAAQLDGDIFICGSDQIWNPSLQYGLDNAYFLEFVPASSKKISYAASFGRSVLPDEFKKIVSTLLHSFHAISVREDSGVQILSEISDKNVHWVLDPTLLLDSYEELIVAIPHTQYIFNYCLRSGQLLNSVVSYVSTKLSLQVVSPSNPHSRWKSVGSTIDPGPQEWVSYIRNADFVITNSYHGTIFSIIFKKPFLVVALEGKKSVNNERARSLLARLGLESRMIYSDSSDEIDAVMNAAIMWDSVYAELKLLRNESMNFLIESIEDEKK